MPASCRCSTRSIRRASSPRRACTRSSAPDATARARCSRAISVGAPAPRRRDDRASCSRRSRRSPSALREAQAVTAELRDQVAQRRAQARRARAQVRDDDRPEPAVGNAAARRSGDMSRRRSHRSRVSVLRDEVLDTVEHGDRDPPGAEVFDALLRALSIGGESVPGLDLHAARRGHAPARVGRQRGGRARRRRDGVRPPDDRRRARVPRSGRSAWS